MESPYVRRIIIMSDGAASARRIRRLLWQLLERQCSGDQHGGFPRLSPRRALRAQPTATDPPRTAAASTPTADGEAESPGRIISSSPRTWELLAGQEETPKRVGGQDPKVFDLGSGKFQCSNMEASLSDVSCFLVPQFVPQCVPQFVPQFVPHVPRCVPRCIPHVPRCVP